jgi:signal peptidase I
VGWGDDGDADGRVAAGWAPARPARPRRDLVIEIVSGAALGVAVLLLVFTVLLTRSWSIPTGANEPTVGPGDWILTGRFGLFDAGAGDLVVYEQPGEPVPNLVSRIVATGGETIEAVDGVVLVDGEPLDEDYLADGTTTLHLPPTVVPEGMVFLLSDNRPNSQDSRFFGPIREDDVIARVVLTTGWSVHRVLLGTVVVFAIVFAVVISQRVTGRPRARFIDPV